MPMKKRKSKKKDSQFLEILAAKARKSPAFDSKASLLEQVLENLLSEGEDRPELARSVMEGLMKDFVDWNEARVSAADRIVPHFSALKDPEYKAKAVQALLGKIFSRSGSLEHQFLIDMETEALEDYLAGIMELREDTRKNLMLRVMNRPTLPITARHEIILERVGTMFTLGDEQIKKTLLEHPPAVLDGIKNLLDTVLDKYCLDAPRCARCPLKPVCVYSEDHG